MNINILFIATKSNDSIKSLHIVSNKQATYICPLHCIEDTTEEIGNKYKELCVTDTFKTKAKEKWFNLDLYSGSNLNLLILDTYE